MTPSDDAHAILAPAGEDHPAAPAADPPDAPARHAPRLAAALAAQLTPEEKREGVTGANHTPRLAVASAPLVDLRCDCPAGATVYHGWNTSHELAFIDGLGAHSANWGPGVTRVTLLQGYAASALIRSNWGRIDAFEARRHVAEALERERGRAA